MPQKVIKFTGINRRVNEYQNSGACEELVNIRPSSTTLEIAKPKRKVFENVGYDIYNHVFGDKSLFIGVVPENNFEIYLIGEDGSIDTIDSFAGNGPEYSIAFVGNQILFSHDKDLRVYAYKNDGYLRVKAGVPDDLDIQYSVSAGYGYSSETSLISSDPQSNEFKEEAQKHWSAALGQNSRTSETFGPVLVAFNFSLSDGTEYWTNKWIHINPFLYLPIGENGKKMIYYESDSVKRFTFNSYDINITISQKTMSESGTDSMMRSVNVYATRPIFPYDIDTMSAKTGGVHDREIYANAVGMNDSGITKQLLYFQKSIPTSEIESGNVSFKLDFGNGQAGERVLEVDAGPVTRSGKISSYNNRAHIYDSYATIHPQSVVCLSDAGDAFYEREAYVYLSCNDDTVVLKTTALVPVASGSSVVRNISCCYPDARATRILIAHPDHSSFSEVTLKPSSRYNYAWGEAKYPGNLIAASKIKTTSNTVHEANAVNVSAPYNPFVFPVEYSYSFGGRVLDIATSYLPISSTQIGQYPLTVFTSAGIYAMEQGDGSVLYSNIVPLQPFVIDGKAAPCPYGTFFVSSKGLYLLSGREAANVSYVLNGKRELNLRENISYKRLCREASGMVTDFSSALSAKDFEDFISDVTLTYDQLQNELYISSNDASVSYSYVFNLDTKSYHKVAKRYIGPQQGGRYAIEISGASRSVVDLHAEEDITNQPVLLQSRPLSLEEAYTHIQRLILLADAKLAAGQYLFLSVFGSDNLYDWKCIISSQKSNSVFRQIRTNRAAKSYRDYVILINGIVDTGTDISDMIADYTVVHRRLG